jgi:hypothetical protein
MTEKSTIKSAILQKLEEHGGGVSFAELSGIKGFGGDIWYGFPEKNIYYWFSCSRNAVDALDELLREGKMELRGTTRLVYFAGNIRPKYPIAKQKRRYTTTRWLPALLYPVASRRLK